MNRSFRFGFLAVLACASTSGTVAVTLGGENDAITQTPAVTSFEIEAVDRSGNRQLLVDAGWASDATLQLGELSQTTIASIQLTAREADGNAVVWGATPFAELDTFDNTSVPLFVQRKHQWARMPQAIGDSRMAPLLVRTARGIYYASGSLDGGIPPTGAYDLLTLADFGSSLNANRAAETFALIQLAQANQEGDLALALLIDHSGADEVGLSTSEAYDAGPFTDPKQLGISWPDIAGAKVIVSPTDSSVYIVGPSKTDAVSRVTVKIDTAGTLSKTSGGARQGAAVAWSAQQGVFVYGGSSTEIGAEIIGGTTSAPTLAPDPAAGLAAVAFDATHMLLAGDGDFAHLIDLTCTINCAKTQWGSSKPPALTAAALFSLGNNAFLLVGDDASQQTQTWRLSETSVDQIQLKIPRQGARAIQTETGQVIILGGGSATLESYVD